MSVVVVVTPQKRQRLQVNPFASSQLHLLLVLQCNTMCFLVDAALVDAASNKRYCHSSPIGAQLL